MSTGEKNDAIAALSAFARIGYSDLLTVIVVSVLTGLAAVPVVTLGGAILAGVDTLTTVIRGEDRRSGPTTERERLRYFFGSFRTNLLRGLPLGLLLTAVVVGTSASLQVAFRGGSTAFLLGLIVGLYAVVLTTIWVYRAASIVVRATDPPGGIGSLRAAWQDMTSDLSWTGLQAVYAATLWLVLAWTQFGMLVLLAGLLAVLEVVVYEERNGYGATTLVRAYRGELRD